MSLQTIYNDYLETDYLSESYAGGVGHGSIYTQFSAQIIDFTNKLNSQFQGVIETTNILNSEMDGTIVDFPNVLGTQFSADIIDFKFMLLSQLEGDIADAKNILKSESKGVIDAFENALKSEFTGDLSSLDNVRSQFLANIVDSNNVLKAEMTATNLFVFLCKFYLDDPGGYLTEDYLNEGLCAGLRTQLLANVLDVLEKTNAQFSATINDFPGITNAQFQGVIIDDVDLLSQFDSQTIGNLNSQFTSILYNNTNIRILCDFPSRGTSGVNWTAKIGAVDISESGDFDINNVNTDIVEQRFQSTSGSVSSINIVCDSEIAQGVTIDTLAILDHNLTTSGSLILQGSNDPAFGTINSQINLGITEKNIYYIADTFPLAPDQNRYWRFQIDDPGNPDNYIRIGCVLFGNAIVMQGDCIEDRIRRRTTDFVDEIETEGFTNVANERTKKRGINLRFPKISFENSTYESLQDIFDAAGTTLKCLWIPDPQRPARFAVFGKLTQIPVEEHSVMGDIGEDLDYVDIPIDIDEAK